MNDKEAKSRIKINKLLEEAGWRFFNDKNYRFGFNGKENDNEVKGTGNSVDFGARMYDSRLGRWLSIDKLSAKFPNESNYIFGSNNPIIYLDFDGNDIVYFNCDGKEIYRIKSKTKFVTYVQVGINVTKDAMGKMHFAPVFEKAPMPGVIKGYEDAIYQKLDYQIAASTFIFNMNLKNDDNLPLTKENHFRVGKTPKSLDVNIVKAMVMAESKMGTYKCGMGTGETDIMQVNNKDDWAPEKALVNLVLEEKMTPSTSLNAGINWLYLKGFGCNGIDKDPNWETERYEDIWTGNESSWWEAVKKYNSRASYLKEVKGYYESETPAKPENYVEN
jgi:RHS repeat-associated protein